MEVRIRHIRSHEWSNIHKYPNCSDAIGPYFTRSGRIHTGLTEEDAERLGSILGVDLRSQSDFWSTFRVRIGSEDIVLDTTDPYDELKYLFLKGHKRVAGSIGDIKAGAHYYISIKEEEAKKANEYSRNKRRAYVEFAKMKPEDIIKALRIYGYKSDNLSEEVAEARLTTLMEANPVKFFEKWVDNKHRATEFLLKEAIAKNVVRKNKNIYSYGTTTLGNSLEDAIYFLDNAENSDLKATVINETQGK